MHKPINAIEIFLQPGDLYCGDRDTRIRTVLGSCVSLTFWHPVSLIGGMCHYMLPNRSNERREASALPLDGRYADEALELLTKEIKAAGVQPGACEVKVFGGGNMFPGRSNPVSNVGIKNAQTARELVARHGLNCVAEHLGGDGHRNIIFDVWSGDVWVKHADVARPDAARDDTRRVTDNKILDWRMQCAVFA